MTKSPSYENYYDDLKNQIIFHLNNICKNDAYCECKAAIQQSFLCDNPCPVRQFEDLCNHYLRLRALP